MADDHRFPDQTMEAIILVTILNVIYREFLRAILYGSKAAGAPTFGPAGRDVGEETWFPSNFVDPAKWFRRTADQNLPKPSSGRKPCGGRD